MDSLNDEVRVSIGCLCAALVMQREEQAEEIIRELRKQDVARETIREAILQVYLFDGYPTAIEGMALLGRVWPGKPEPVEDGDFTEWETWQDRGHELYRLIYGNAAEQLMENAAGLSPELARWMIIEGYGKVLARDGLDIITRELINVAVLAIKRRPRQLHSHLRGALMVGASRELIGSLFTEIKKRFVPVGIDEAIELFASISN